MSQKTYSFDIFDTCLVRVCGKPEFVFDILAYRVLGENVSDAQLEDFALIRRQAESEAYKRFLSSEKEEITLNEIYQCCDFSVLCDVPNEKIMVTELQIEKEVLLAVYDIRNKIKGLREKGVNILYISDMYLPSSFIQDVLVSQGLFKKGDELFVSSEYGKRKSTGSLYKMISDKKQVSFKNWTHFGDNRWSDIKIPKKLGINAKRIYHKQTFYERLLASKDMTTSRYNLICMSFISKALRLSYTQSPQYSVACDFIAPLYVPFVYSVLFDASKRGIEKLFFLARDAKILLDIAKVFQKQFPQIQMTYLYVSRKSLYLPSIGAPTFDEISPFFSSFPDVTLLDVLDKLQMTEHLDKFSSYDSLSGKELLENLLKDEKFCSILKQLSNNQRDLCIKYFKQVEMTDSKSAIIDLSGTRKCHVAINKILKAEGYREVFAYYFEVLEERYPGKNYESVFFADRYSFNRLNIVKRPQLVFEQYFSAADHNTTASYAEKGGVVIPVFDNDSISDDKKKEIYNVNKSVCVNYANYYLKFVEKGMSLYYTRAVLSVYTTFYCAPSPYFLKAFANLSLSETLIRTHQVLRRSSIFSIIRNPRKGWFFGNMVYNTIFPKLMEKMLLLLHLYYKLKDRTPGC